MKKNKKTRPEIQSWYKDRYQRVVVQRKILVAITLVSMVTTLASVFIISQLMPLKTIEPYVIQVDSKSGVVQTVNPETAKELTVNEAVNNYFIVQYVRAREGYSAMDLVYKYDLVRLMSENLKVYPKFRTEANPNNPGSNVARLGNGGTRTVRIKSITYLQPQLAQVRILITETGGTGVVEVHKIALVSFEYAKMSLSLEERYSNPLGFRVTDYKIEDDASQ